MRSANLVIMLTDIAGYTAATSRHTRAQNEKLIASHNNLLLPLITTYGGKHIKSVGDSLLVIFESPTDALLCSMAMQDTLFIHNRGSTRDSSMQIRIALNLGEVRLENNDVFGDPVNTTSRIEGITPPGEIYFSESVYMTMNRAEVNAEFVCEKRFSGVPEPVKLYRIPPFTIRLESSSDGRSPIGDATLPFAGLHIPQAEPVNSGRIIFIRNVLAISSVAMLFLVIGMASFRYAKKESKPAVIEQVATPLPSTPKKSLQEPNYHPQNIPQVSQQDSTQSEPPLVRRPINRPPIFKQQNRSVPAFKGQKKR